MIKLIHVLAFMAFVSLLMYLMFNWRKVSSQSFARLVLTLFVSLVLSVGLGMLLVPQKGYFFTTPWIMAAMMFSGVLVALLGVVFLLHRRYARVAANSCYAVAINVLLSLSLLISVVIIHDAVTKMTELML